MLDTADQAVSPDSASTTDSTDTSDSTSADELDDVARVEQRRWPS